MLPKLSQSALIHQESCEQRKNDNQDPQSHNLEDEGIKQLEQCQVKLEEELTLNTKLKNLYRVMKEKIDKNSTANEEQEELENLMKEKKKNQTDFQHQCHLYNLLVSENNKLKEQVNSERSKRVIYFNIYKNLEHQIHIWQGKYKNGIIQSLKAEGVMIKIKEKFYKSNARLRKQINTLKKEIQNCLNLPISPEKKHEHVLEDNIRVSKPKKSIFNTKSEKKDEQILQASKEMAAVQFSRRESENSFDFQQKKVILYGIVEKIKQICQIEELNDLKEFWRCLEGKTEEKYDQFQKNQKKEKALSEQIQQIKQKIKKTTQIANERKQTTKKNESTLTKVNKIQNQVQILEKEVSETIGIDIKNLESDMILHHSLRVKEGKNEQKREARKNLQKFLEQSKKDKIECSVLLSPKQMHKRLVESQAYGNESGLYNY